MQRYASNGCGCGGAAAAVATHALDAAARARLSTLPHAASHMCIVAMRGSAVVVVAGGAHISATWASNVTSPSMTQQQQQALPSPALSSFALTRGVVTALHAAPLPRALADVAIGVAGTSNGTLCVFELHDAEVVKLGEVALFAYNNNSNNSDMSDSDDTAVTNVRIAFDAAGRPECVVAATATAVVLVRLVYLLQRCNNNNNNNNNNNSHMTAYDDDDDDGQDVFVAAFADAPLVRVLVPEQTQHYAAFAPDVAALLVFADGTLRYVARRVRGGAVHALSTLRRAQMREDGYCYDDDDDDEEQPSPSQHGAQHATSAVREAVRHTLPHVRYRYALSDVQFALCDNNNNSSSSAVCGDVGGGVVVNDAALVYNASTGRMDMLLAGAHVSPSSLSSRQHARAMGWWACARNVVLPQHTLRSLRVRETHARGVAARVDAQGVSPHTIHVCTATVALQSAAASTAHDSACACACGGGGVGLSSVTVLPEHAVAVFTCGADVHACTLRNGLTAATLLAAAATNNNNGADGSRGAAAAYDSAMTAAAATATQTVLPPLHLVHVGSDVIECVACLSSPHRVRNRHNNKSSRRAGAAAVLLGAGTTLTALDA